MIMVWQSLKNETNVSLVKYRRENESLSPSVDVLHKTSNLIISCCFSESDKEMDEIENRTCKVCTAIVFAH